MSSLGFDSGKAAGTASTRTGSRWPHRLPAQYAPSTRTSPSASRRRPPPLFFRSLILINLPRLPDLVGFHSLEFGRERNNLLPRVLDRKSTRLNSSHHRISYAV